MAERCDVAVVGGGPAGATVSTFLARAGLEVVCFERERFPRFHAGESLLPASMPLFERYYDPAFLDLFFGPRPLPTLKDALTTVFAGGAFLEQPLWLRARLTCVRLGVQVARARRRRLGLPVESQLAW